MGSLPVNLKERWYEAGISILSKPDFYCIKMEYLCQCLALTKGSFYHHFKSIAEYETGLLKLIKKKFTVDIINSIQSDLTSEEKFKQLSELIRKTPVYLGVNIRKWAAFNQKPLNYQREVDTIRIGFLKKILMEDGLNEQKADVVAKARYITFIGIENFALTYSIDMNEAIQIESLFTEMFSNLLKNNA